MPDEEKKAVAPKGADEEAKKAEPEPAADTTAAAAKPDPPKEAEAKSDDAADGKKAEETGESAKTDDKPKDEAESTDKADAKAADKPKAKSEEAGEPAKTADKPEKDKAAADKPEEDKVAVDKPKENKAKSTDKADAEATDEKKSEETAEPAKADDEPKKDESESTDEAAEEDEEMEEADTKAEEPIVLRGRGRRERKSTQAYQPMDEKPKKEKVIHEGKGEKLEDMPNVVANFKGVTWSDPHLSMLHTVIYGRGKKKEFKKKLLNFNGVVYPEGEEKEEDAKEKLLQKMYKLKMDELKAVMDLADIDRSADSFDAKIKIPDKLALCNRFLEWLEKPTASEKNKGGARKTPKKRKSDASEKKTPSAKKAKKSPAKNIKTTSASKKTAPKKAAPKKKATPKKKKVTKEAAVKSPSKKAKKTTDEPVELSIPGVDIEKVRGKVKSIVEGANREELTVKGVRKMLEDWLDIDLSEHKNAIRAIVMEVM